MKIQVGIGSEEELEYFLAAGADELYCGSDAVPGHLYGGENFGSPADIAGAVRLAHRLGRKFYFAANEIQAGALDATVRLVKKLAARGLDGVIVRDVSLLERLKPAALGIEYILTSLAPCYNDRALEFYAGLGVTRLALPEQLLPREAEPLIKNGLGVGTEMFLTAREYCVVLNGLCYLKQFNGRCLCRAEFRPAGRGKFVMPRPGIAEHFGRLYELRRLGVPVLKVGRHPTKGYSRIAFSEAQAVNKLLESGLPKGKFVKLALGCHGRVEDFLRKCEREN